MVRGFPFFRSLFEKRLVKETVFWNILSFKHEVLEFSTVRFEPFCEEILTLVHVMRVFYVLGYFTSFEVKNRT